MRQKNILYGVVVLITDEKNEFLMIKQNKEPFRDYWGPIHGGVEVGESQEDAVIRETKEETQLTVLPLKRIATTNADYKVDRLYWWFAKIVSGHISCDKREISEHGFFCYNDVMKLNLFPETRRFFEKHKAQLSSAQPN